METDEMARRRARRLDNSRLRKYRDKNAPKVSKSFSLFSYIYFTVLVDTRFFFILLYCWERKKREMIGSYFLSNHDISKHILICYVWEVYFKMLK